MSAARRARLKATVEPRRGRRGLDKCYAAAELMHKKARRAARARRAADSPDAAARSRALDVAYVYWQRYAALAGGVIPKHAAQADAAVAARRRAERGCGRASARASPSSSGSSAR